MFFSRSMLTIAIYLIVSITMQVQAKTLSLSGTLNIEVDPPEAILHSGSMLLLKYNDWTLSHEVIDPKNYLGAVDLTGNLKPYIRSLFGYKNQRIADWLLYIANKQEKILGLDKADAEQFNITSSEVLAIYNQGRNQGEIFILEDLQVHKIDIVGSKKWFDKFLDQLRRL